MNMAKMMLNIIVNKVIIKCINIIVIMILNMKVNKVIINSNDDIEYESEDDGIEYYMY